MTDIPVNPAPKHFKAPWGTSLIVTSAIGSIACLWPAFLVQLRHLPLAVGFSLGSIIYGIPLICALFIIRGYTITAGEIVVKRLFWNTRLSRTGMQSAVYTPNAMSKSLRCGNGGFYSFTGWYWNNDLGSYRAFVTDPKQTVVLRYEKRTIVISPESPEEFAHTLMAG